MTESLFDQIEQAERQAEQIQADARREAREILQSARAAIQSSEGDAMRDVRAGCQMIGEEARVTTEDEVRALEVRRSAQREAMRLAAGLRLESAVQAIYERILSDGHR